MYPFVANSFSYVWQSSRIIAVIVLVIDPFLGDSLSERVRERKTASSGVKKQVYSSFSPSLLRQLAIANFFLVVGLIPPLTQLLLLWFYESLYLFACRLIYPPKIRMVFAFNFVPFFFFFFSTFIGFIFRCCCCCCSLMYAHNILSMQKACVAIFFFLVFGHVHSFRPFPSVTLIVIIQFFHHHHNSISLQNNPNTRMCLSLCLFFPLFQRW